jgi:putative alpha-1,2-mannosidase
MKIKFSGILIIIIFLNTMVLPGQNKQPADYVDPMIGTSNSRWMLYPGPSLPFGMVKLSPDNQEQAWKAGYEYTIENIAGFSHLHSWTMGGLLTMPITGALVTNPGSVSSPTAGWTSGYRSRFKHENEEASPGYYSVLLHDYDIRAELTSTLRTGFQRYTFPEVQEAYILFDLEFPTEYGFEVLDANIKKVSNTEIEGYVKQRSTSYNEYTVHFVAKVDRPFESLGSWKGEVTA